MKARFLPILTLLAPLTSHAQEATAETPAQATPESWVDNLLANFTSQDLYGFATMIGLLVVGIVLGVIVQAILARIGSKRREDKYFKSGIFLQSLGTAMVPLLMAVGLRTGKFLLDLTEDSGELTVTVASILFVLAFGIFLFSMVDLPVSWLRRRAEKTDTKMDDMLVPLAKTTLRAIVVVLVGLQIVDMLSDEPLTSILAGLGIGSLAIAFAAQNTISNFFGSIMIFADRPFDLGERVIVDGHDGAVESVGLRSTRIRRLDGHLVTIPNGRLADMSIHNVGKRPYIRKVMNVTITYDTPPEKVERAVAILRDIFDNHEGMKEDFPPRIYFNDFNADSLNIIVIFWYHPPAYWDFLDFCQRVNLEIFRSFNDEGIDFAFPTQTLYLAGDESRPLSVGVRDLNPKE